MNSVARKVLKFGGVNFFASRAMHDFKFIKWSQDDAGVRRITLANVKTRNALSQAAMKEITSGLKGNSEANRKLRCVVLDSEGPVFSAGHNLKELRTADGIHHHRAVFDTCSTMIATIRSLSVPVVAQVRGVAAAAGCQLVASCDIVVAGGSSSFSTPGANFGLFCSTPGVALVRNVPLKIASLMLFTGRPIDAETALRAGLVSVVVPDDQLEAKTSEIVADIVHKSKPVIEIGKAFLNKQVECASVEEAYRDGSAVMVENLRLKDAQEGISSFAEKRKASWSHEDSKVH